MIVNYRIDKKFMKMQHFFTYVNEVNRGKQKIYLIIGKGLVIVMSKFRNIVQDNKSSVYN